MLVAEDIRKNLDKNDETFSFSYIENYTKSPYLANSQSGNVQDHRLEHISSTPASLVYKEIFYSDFDKSTRSLHIIRRLRIVLQSAGENSVKRKLDKRNQSSYARSA